MLYTKLLSSCFNEQELVLLQSVINKKIDLIESISKSHYMHSQVQGYDIGGYLNTSLKIVFDKEVLVLKCEAEYTSITNYIERIHIQKIDKEQYNKIIRDQIDKEKPFALGADDWIIESIKVFGDNYFTETLEVGNCNTPKGNWLLDTYEIPHTYTAVIIHKRTTYCIAFIFKNKQVLFIRTIPTDFTNYVLVFCNSYQVFEECIVKYEAHRQKQYVGNCLLHYEIDATGIHKIIDDEE